MENKITYISIDKLIPHPQNPRKELGDLTELADSIKANGVYQNLTVVEDGDDTYKIIIGHRRHAAAKIASGQKTIEVRKTRPKIEEPFKCYIYCTKNNPIMGRNLWLNDDGSVRYNAFEKCEEEDFDRYNQDHLFKANGMVIGEFVCDRIVKASPGDYNVFCRKG